MWHAVHRICTLMGARRDRVSDKRGNPLAVAAKTRRRGRRKREKKKDGGRLLKGELLSSCSRKLPKKVLKHVRTRACRANAAHAAPSRKHMYAVCWHTRASNQWSFLGAASAFEMRRRRRRRSGGVEGKKNSRGPFQRQSAASFFSFGDDALAALLSQDAKKKKKKEPDLGSTSVSGDDSPRPRLVAARTRERVWRGICGIMMQRNDSEWFNSERFFFFFFFPPPHKMLSHYSNARAEGEYTTWARRGLDVSCNN